MERAAEAGRTRRVVPRDGVGHRFQNSLVGSDEPRLRCRAAKEGAERSGTAPLLSVSLSPSGGVQSSRASRATRTRLFYVLGSVKDSLFQGLGKLARVSLSPHADHARSLAVDPSRGE